jgi:hypothetical protein
MSFACTVLYLTLGSHFCSNRPRKSFIELAVSCQMHVFRLLSFLAYGKDTNAQSVVMPRGMGGSFLPRRFKLHHLLVRSLTLASLALPDILRRRIPSLFPPFCCRRHRRLVPSIRLDPSVPPQSRTPFRDFQRPAHRPPHDYSERILCYIPQDLALPHKLFPQSVMEKTWFYGHSNGRHDSIPPPAAISN